ncbi:uncharacterized protein LOC106058531 isoform X1 [Biomphalaria glabrata]|uniref:Uncharacterized protein LOC106058531 isoform X1 n=1 Tax=Biomphalaria glabrata TaxID=6526 RepID=A0A9W3AHV9_BIOGL|nr:uncharacterized protein LOC106058531 isoform X1 [Biomphalaria glabrata]
MYYFYFFQDLLSHLMLKLCFLASEFVLVTLFLVEAQVPCKKEIVETSLRINNDLALLQATNKTCDLALNTSAGALILFKFITTGLNIAQSTLLFSGCLLEVTENSDSVALIIKINFSTTNLTLIYRYSDNCNHMDSIWCRVLIYHNSPDWTTVYKISQSSPGFEPGTLGSEAKRFTEPLLVFTKYSEPAPPDEIPKAAVPMLIPIIVSLLILLAIIFGFLYCYSNKMYIFKDELSTSYITTESTSTRDKMNPIVL